MSINSIVINALKDISIPVAFQNYTGSEKIYITFFEYNQTSALNTDDEEQRTAHYIQVDVWSNTDYTNIVDQVKERMKLEDFSRTSEADFYEKDTSIFHKAIRFKGEF
ncbi:hypothetical protein [Chengkuizengella marina]|uniref:DUF3168 domain-containing protein n=1 Tax=Chengkuizengella marina TaxID=2507566 RepID=A0A6N9Q791_9BACL|nr:hypothetical protein [Chengkuizengella marina]NBI30736.1 hypothetical protein [Chengkuizengella marina]